jgi:uncharacterized membrane protein YidH (DUF202 family)
VTQPEHEPDLIDSGHPEELTPAEALNQRVSNASQAASEAFGGIALAIVALTLGVAAFLVGQVGFLIATLRTPGFDRATHVETESVAATAAIIAGVGLVAGVLAVLRSRGSARAWQREFSLGALVVALLAAGLHAVVWVLAIYHHGHSSIGGF